MSAQAFTSGAKWSWPEEEPTSPSVDETPLRRPPTSEGWTTDDAEGIHAPETSHPDTAPEEAQSHVPPKNQKHYPPRTCRICLEVVLPTYETASEGLAGMLNPAPRVQYISQDPESGRLIRPCKCKGSQRYVHEGCLQAWRHADPAYGRRNYWECPTCKFRYRLERMQWSRWISSTLAQVVLTLLILFTTIFLLGFVADPIISLWLDPIGTLTTNPFSSRTGYPIPGYEDEEATWADHILKGLASLGLVGVAKAALAMGPWQWYHLRNSGLLGGGARNGRAATGRDRLESVTWWVVFVGLMTVLYVSRIHRGVSRCNADLISLGNLERSASLESKDS
jgi:hypothetical protein